ncbi:SsgA family sporulation/cell division regulator [Phytoactinopolyspora mesophila]|uniref:SsgA family sporulation/cell division regulator n=1 Tax=Phytoactinopolyspora mesophila TaxID=2650750 RepID=A0A7K3LYY4_9ACTN|nr:SsgA family sporulation/cell division regulator [Phytoactinopolyspora mesophila]NDL56234.1 SsgA family sporulation/cell division regulator [Phytoactinopolyspora mesophila]
MERTMVSYPMTLQLLTTPTGARPLPAEFHYYPNDPLAVTILFDSRSEAPVRWVFARELLSDGLDRQAGLGDVSICPVEDEHGLPSIQIQLSSPDGDAFIVAPAEEVEEFLARTWRAVPPGTESSRLNIDLALDALLNGA